VSPGGLFLGDVGASSYEELDIARGGDNLGSVSAVPPLVL
jgi:hypothetical protein